MGFSFRSLYTDDVQLEGKIALSSLPTVSVTERPGSPKAVMSGIPGPLRAGGPVQAVVNRQVDSSALTSLDELDPEPVLNITPDFKHSDVRPFAAVPADRGPREAVITLRAIFSTADEFTLERVAALTAELPGITSCFIKTSGREVLATGELETVQSVEATIDFPRPESFQSACDLLGLEGMSGLMLRSEVGSLSCFSFAEVSLMTRHSEAGLEPGLWEKLILITQATAEMNLSD